MDENEKALEMRPATKFRGMKEVTGIPLQRGVPSGIERPSSTRSGR